MAQENEQSDGLDEMIKVDGRGFLAFVRELE